jgi:hypothetical protein
MVTQAPVVARPKAPPETPAEGPHLSDEQLNEAMALIGASDSVELKVTVPVEDHRATIAGLPIDPVEAQLRQVWFFDTPDLALNRAGVVVRARRRTGGRGDTVIKLRPVVPDELPRGIRRSASFNVEVDILPGGFVCSGSLKGVCKGNEVSDAVAGKIALPAIYSKEQRAFYATYVRPRGSISIRSCRWGRLSCSRKSTPPISRPRRRSRARWQWRCGSIRTDRASSSCLRAVIRMRSTRWVSRREPTWCGTESSWAASSRPRPKPHWSSSRHSCRRSRALSRHRRDR